MQLLATIYTVCFIWLYNMLYCFSQHILCIILLPNMFYSFPSMSPCFSPCFNALMMLAQLSWARICQNSMFVLRSICLSAFCYVYAQTNMFMCSLSCLCLDLHVYVLLAIFTLKSACLCAPFHVHAQICIFECSMSCSYVSICRLLCHVLLQPICLLMYLCLALWHFRKGVDLDLVVQVYIHTPRPISKGLDHFLYAILWMVACFYALSLVCLSRSRLCPILCPS